MQQEISHKYGLVNDFTLVSKRLKRRLPVILAAGDYLPPADLRGWNSGRFIDRNCYTFARNLPDLNFLQPGGLIQQQKGRIANDAGFLPDGVEPVSAHPILRIEFRNAMPAVYGYAQSVIQQLENDQPAGWLGYDLTLPPKGWPAALFFRSSLTGRAGYHWYPLRRKGEGDDPDSVCGFAHKMGPLRAEWVPANDIFKDAKKTGYTYFAGFFHFDSV